MLSDTPKPKTLREAVREQIRLRHLSLRTERAYQHWIQRFVTHHGRRSPRDLGAVEVELFLTHLAVERKVSASTQNQALQALLFLYRHVLGVDLPWLGNVVRARQPQHLLVVSVATGSPVRHHLHEKTIQRAMQPAVRSLLDRD